MYGNKPLGSVQCGEFVDHGETVSFSSRALLHGVNLCFLSFQLIEIVGSVLDRPLIREDFTGKYDTILGMLDEEMITVKVCHNLLN